MHWRTLGGRRSRELALPLVELNELDDMELIAS
jgi:hypothetical protein